MTVRRHNPVRLVFIGFEFKLVNWAMPHSDAIALHQLGDSLVVADAIVAVRLTVLVRPDVFRR